MHSNAKGSFTKLFWLLVGGILLFCVVMGLLTWRQGPRIRSVVFDRSRVAHVSGERLVLTLNEPVPAVRPADVKVTPRAQVSTLSSGKTIVVQFAEPLHAEQAYQVRIQLTKHRQVTYQFKTDPLYFYSLSDAPTPEPDSIRRHAVGGGEGTVVYSTPGIKEYGVLAGGELLLVVAKDAARDQLLRVMPDGQVHSTVRLPGDGMVTHLQVAPDKRGYGLTFTAAGEQGSQPGRLYAASSVTDDLRPVKGVGGQSVQTFSWRFMPAGRAVVAQLFDTSLVLADLAAGSAVPLGQFNRIVGFTSDGKGVVATHPQAGEVVLTLPTLQRRAFLEVPGDSERVYVTDMTGLPAARGYIFALQSLEAGVSRQWVALQDAKGPRTLLNVQNPQAILLGMTASPSGQYVVVEMSKSMPTGGSRRQLQVIATATGKVVHTVPTTAGFVQW